MLYRVNGELVVEVGQTTMQDEVLFETQVEDWVAQRPEMLGERLLIVGRQVTLDTGKDRIDLLALDGEGSLVVIELKRDLIGGDADLQALRYCAMVGDWTEADIRKQAEGYWESVGEEHDFLEVTQALCGDEAALNTSQRLILVGRDIKPRLGTMALWLIDQGVDVRVVAVTLLNDESRLYLQPQIVIPPPSELKVGSSPGPSKKPWLVNGRAWHLEQRCGPEGRAIFERIMDLIAKEAPDAEGPSWSQKLYISWAWDGKGWAYLHPGARRVVLDVKKVALSAEGAAARLGYEVFDEDSDLKAKFALGSSIAQQADGLRILVKSIDDVSDDAGGALGLLLRDAWAAMSGKPPSQSIAVYEQPPTHGPAVPAC